METEVRISNSETDNQSLERDSLVDFDELGFREVTAEGSLDFDEWTSLISEIENLFPDDIEKICVVYDSFLSEFPLCYGYWRKYADHKARLCTVDKVVEVFERAVQSATYSVGVWVDYCSLGITVFEDPNDVRRLFKRGISYVGKDYLCDTLWDKYVEFEFSQQQWSSLAHIYIQTLRFPTKKLNRYYESFKKLAAAWKEETECQSDSTMELQSEPLLESAIPTCYTDDEISCVIKDLLDPSIGLAGTAGCKALHKYLCIGEWFYQEACQLDEKIHCFETHIRRSYFHVKPLDASQLENWHDYLNFAEMHGDFDWAVKLYERCLIPCANYPEFWMRYVEFMESKGGREIANFALARATQTFLKRVPVIHLFNARFKEQIGDVSGARAAFLLCDTESDSSFVENVMVKANMEKRLGNFVAASNIYEEALEIATVKKKSDALPTLYIHFSQLKYMITESADAARDILIDGIKHVPYCKLLLEELIKFSMLHGGSKHINVLDSIIANAISPGPGVSQGLSAEDVEDISSLYIQFVDLCGTIYDVRKAWNRHIKLFPHSMRTTTNKPPARSIKLLKMGRQETSVALPQQSSGDCSPAHPIQLSFQEEKLSPTENDDAHSDHAATEQVSDQKSTFPENHGVLSDQATIDLLQSGEADNSVQERVQQLFPEVSEQPREDSTEPNLSSLDLVHRVANEIEAVQTSIEFSKEKDVQQEYDNETEKDEESLSLERLSLDLLDDKSLGSIHATSHKCEASQETSFSNGSTVKSEPPEETTMSNGSILESGQNTCSDRFISSQMEARASDSAQIQIGIGSPSSSGSHQNIITKEALSRPQTPANRGGNWHQRSGTEKNRRDSKFGFRGHSYKKQHQQRQISPQQYRRAETGTRMSKSQGYPSQPLPSLNPQGQQGSQEQSQYPATATHANLTAPQAGSVQNVQQQNFASTFQPQLPSQPVTYSQAQMSQYPMESNDQYGHMQNNQAYNQMWQYYYYQQQQQQQFILQQQQQLQLQQHLQQQQPHQPELLQQQYQQQQQLQLQQHYLQQQQLQQQQLSYQQLQLPDLQQQLQLQQQQQQLYTQQQQQLQLQQHQQQLLQQQPYQQQQLQQQQQQLQQQQHLLYMQQQQLQPQLPQDQQQLQHQQQQHQQPPEQQQQEQSQHEQQIATSEIQTQNDNCRKEEALEETGQQIVASQV